MNLPYQILDNIDLADLTTFGVPAIASRFVSINDVESIQALIRDGEKINLILGGGSNLLFTSPLNGLVAKNNLLGKSVLSDYADSQVLVAFGGGENWHDAVLWSLEQGFAGIENLSLIPGTIGAAPIQNIGAYGVELADVFHQLEAIDLETGAVKTFDKKDCAFSYRYSIFKGSLKGKFIITKVVLRLSKNAQVNVSYGAIQDTLNQMGISNPGPKEVSNAVTQIRQSKLPDPNELGNAGSFFKNPIITLDHFIKLKLQYPDVPSYPIDDSSVKVPAGWLIEKAGWKGKQVGKTGCHAKQALVIVNHGGANGQEIFEHAQRVATSIKTLFNISLEMEVNVVGGE